MYSKDHGVAMMGICKQRNDAVRFVVLREIPLTAMCKEEKTMKPEIPASRLCKNLNKVVTVGIKVAVVEKYSRRNKVQASVTNWIISVRKTEEKQV